MLDSNELHIVHRSRRLFIGAGVLILINIIIVMCHEMTTYLFDDVRELPLYSNETVHESAAHTYRPYFSTYVHCSMFALYLLGFLSHRQWRDQCLQPFDGGIIPTGEYEDEELEMDAFSQMSASLSEPEFEPINTGSDSDRSSIVSDQDANESPPEDPSPPPRSVRFAKIHEVRRMPITEANEARLSRLPYELWLRAARVAQRYRSRLPLRHVLRFALQLGPLLFAALYARQIPREQSINAANSLHCSIGLFALIFAVLLPANNSDRISFSKLLIALLGLSGGIMFILLSGNAPSMSWDVYAALAAAALYALYLVLLRRQIDSEEKLEMPMFFGCSLFYSTHYRTKSPGFIGLFSFALAWPGLYILHATNAEQFYPLPTRAQMACIAMNGIINTVLVEYMMLWACFLTSSFIVALSLPLTIPMTAIAESILWKKSIRIEYYVSAAPLIIAFTLAVLLQQRNTREFCSRSRLLVVRRRRRNSSDTEMGQSLLENDEL